MICVDSSVAAKWIFREIHSEMAWALYGDSAATSRPLVAPPIFPFEVANVIRKRMRRDGLALSAAEQLLGFFLAMPVEVVVPPDLHHRALVIADRYGLPAIYDAHFVALAEWVACDLWTDDQRLLRALADRLPFVRWIGDYPIAR